MKKLTFAILFFILVGIFIFGVLNIVKDKLNIDLFEGFWGRITEIVSSKKEEIPIEEDTTGLEIETRVKEILTLKPKTAFAVFSNKEITMKEKDNANMIFIEKSDNKYIYVVEIWDLGIGKSTVNFEFFDLKSNSKKLNMEINYEGFSLPLGISEIKDWENSKYTVLSDNLLARVDKKHKILPDYKPSDLFVLFEDPEIIANDANISLRIEAKDALKLMLRELKAQTGENLLVISGYRSYNEQYRIYSGYLRTYIQEEVDTFSARAGFSEHQLGTVVDFTNKEVNYSLTNDFGNTTAGKWLLENSYKFGYLQTYPKRKELETGYQHEAWHYRYVGIDNAKSVQESGLTLTEWLELRTPSSSN